MAIAGSIVVVGASGDDPIASGSGAAYVYRREDSSWASAQALIPSSRSEGDGFGAGAAVTTDWVAVGASGDDIPEGSVGSITIFQDTGLEWVESGYLYADDTVVNDLFGGPFGISGDLVAAGAPQHDVAGEDAGAVYVFQFSGDTWVQLEKLTPVDDSDGYRYGAAVALSGTICLISAPGEGSAGVVHVVTVSE